MPSTAPYSKIFPAMILLVVFCNALPGRALANEDMETLQLYYEGKDLVVSASRTPKPLSQVAENITIVTAADIEALNAHTVGEVLATVTGVQMDQRRGPGNSANLMIQGAPFWHVLVLIDGVPLNNLSDSFPDLGVIPVQFVERIEIIKGPASSSWGSALGGVINIITKSPAEERRLGGALSASVGEQMTNDYRGELTGTAGNVGYYLAGTNLSADARHFSNRADETGLYGKLRWPLANQDSLLFTIGYNEGVRREGELPSVDFLEKIEHRYLFSSLTLTSTITDQLKADLALRAATRHLENAHSAAFGNLPVTFVSDEASYGGSAKLSWRQELQTLVAGADFDHGNLDQQTKPALGTLDKLGLFANDTISVGPVTVTPGVRYDNSSHFGDFLSSSLGVTYSLTEKTLFRTMAARGFSNPTLINGPNLEKVWSVQAGFESTELDFCRLKTTLFQSETSDILSSLNSPIRERQRRRGVEVELQTVPLFHLSLATGLALLDVTDLESGQLVEGAPCYTVDTTVRYAWDGYRANLSGHYIRWNPYPQFNGRYSAMIWDLALGANIAKIGGTELELFATVHNLFSGSQNQFEFYENLRRWVEGGLKVRF